VITLEYDAFITHEGGITMGFLSKVQVIERANNTRQFYFNCPAPLAEAMEFEKSETIEWVVVDKYTLTIKRKHPRRSAHKAIR